MELYTLLLKEHEGEIAKFESNEFSIAITYTSGSLALFNKLEIFCLDLRNFLPENGKIKVKGNLQDSLEVFSLQFFFPILI